MIQRASKQLIRFAKYTFVGTSTFAFDLALLFVLTELFHLNYLISAGAAYLIAISINYVFSRRYVFAGTLRSVHAGYVIFLLIAGAGHCDIDHFRFSGWFLFALRRVCADSRSHVCLKHVHDGFNLSH